MIDAATDITENDYEIEPNESFAICAYCGTIMMYTTDDDGVLSVRAPTKEEIYAFAREKPNEFAMMVKLIEALRNSIINKQN
jgi:hypothetical protein